MRRLRRIVAGHDVFVWASEILDNLERLAMAPLGFSRSVRSAYLDDGGRRFHTAADSRRLPTA